MSKDISIDIKQIRRSGKQLLTKARRYSTFAFILAILFIYAFLVLRISSLSQTEPTDDAIAEKAGSVKRLKIDENAISKIKQLQDQNIAVQALFEEARNNPFE